MMLTKLESGGRTRVSKSTEVNCRCLERNGHVNKSDYKICILFISYGCSLHSGFFKLKPHPISIILSCLVQFQSRYSRLRSGLSQLVILVIPILSSSFLRQSRLNLLLLLFSQLLNLILTSIISRRYLVKRIILNSFLIFSLFWFCLNPSPLPSSSISFSLLSS
jgi:hypothetical protein